MKTDITYNIKPQKQRETYVLFAVTLFFRKTKIKSVLFFVFCLILVHVVWAGEREGGKITGRVQTP